MRSSCVGASLLAIRVRKYIIKLQWQKHREAAAAPCGLLHFPHPCGSQARSYRFRVLTINDGRNT